MLLLLYILYFLSWRCTKYLFSVIICIFTSTFTPIHTRAAVAKRNEPTRLRRRPTPLQVVSIWNHNLVNASSTYVNITLLALLFIIILFFFPFVYVLLFLLLVLFFLHTLYFCFECSRFDAKFNFHYFISTHIYFCMYVTVCVTLCMCVGESVFWSGYIMCTQEPIFR